MHTGRKSWELLLRNRTWDARRATVGPHLAAISGQLRALRVSAIGVCTTAPTGRGILPSWSCEFDSRHPLQSIGPSQCAFTAPELFEQGDNKNNQAGHLPFMIIGRPTYAPCQAGFHEL